MGEHIGTFIAGFLEKKQKQVEQNRRIQAAIEENIDEKTKKHITSIKIQKNKLIVCFDAPAARYEFNLKKERVRRRVQEEFPKIKEILAQDR